MYRYCLFNISKQHICQSFLIYKNCILDTRFMSYKYFKFKLVDWSEMRIARLSITLKKKYIFYFDWKLYKKFISKHVNRFKYDKCYSIK